MSTYTGLKSELEAVLKVFDEPLSHAFERALHDADAQAEALRNPSAYLRSKGVHLPGEVTVEFEAQQSASQPPIPTPRYLCVKITSRGDTIFYLCKASALR